MLVKIFTLKLYQMILVMPAEVGVLIFVTWGE